MEEYILKAKDGPIIIENSQQEIIWQESYNYVVPWNAVEDISTLLESKSAITVPRHCGLYSSSPVVLSPFQPIKEDDKFS